MPLGTQAFGGGANETLLHPLVAVAMILTIILILLLPRKYAIVPFLLFVFLTPLPQGIYLGGFHVYAVRILIVAGLARIIWEKVFSNTSFCSGGFNSVDKAFLLWAIVRALAPMVVYRGDLGAIVYEVGFLWDVVGGYFLVRFLIRDGDDISIVVKTFASITLLLGLAMLNEKLRFQNIFGFLGGVSITPDTREGSIRAQGPFAHAILAGVFAATLLPLFIWLWKSGKFRIAGILGVIGATTMVAVSASSTPLMSYLAVILGICFWPFRKSMRGIRWGIVIGLIALHMVMKAPVWFLIDHVDLVAGNSGYHRAMLIDTCIRHFTDWWLVGTNQAMNWGYDMWDLSNQFVAEAETGGLVAFICFVLIVSRSFARIGRARKFVEGDNKAEWFLWLLGVALFAHVVAYFGISYFDETRISWFTLLAIIAAATVPTVAREPVFEEVRDVWFPNSRLAYPPLSASSSRPGRLLSRN